MNSKSLTLNNLGIIEELNFIRSYHKYLLEYCIENEISYDGKIAVAIGIIVFILFLHTWLIIP